MYEEDGLIYALHLCAFKELQLAVDWKSVAELARRAQIHYKTNLEAVMEEKLSDVVRLKALQRIQRIDSFMIDSTVTKLEKSVDNLLSLALNRATAVTLHM